jgi:carboxyl-terminal processing protease
MNETIKIPRSNALRTSFFVYGAVVLLLGSFLTGVVLGNGRLNEGKTVGKVINKSAAAEYETKDVDMAQFWKVWEMVKSDYLHADTKATDPKLFYGALKGIVSSLGDPYSVYFDPDEASAFSRQLEGSFDGIGAEIGFRGEQMIVIAPLPGTPAMNAGIKAGDAVLKINGEETVGMPLDTAISKIRGPKGTTVTLNVGRVDAKDAFDVVITRDTIVIDSVTTKMLDDEGKETDKNGGVAYIDISEFGEETVSEFDAALKAMTMRNAKGIIIDLRNDPGGYLDAAVEVPRAWVGKKPVVIQRKADGTEIKLTPRLNITAVKLPTVVLVNSWSASASEIVAGAMQDYGVATIVGETTFGKGSVQEYVDNLPDGSALKITTAEWLTPNGRSIDKKGIKPDAEVKLTDEDIKNKLDPQLKKALEIIKNGFNPQQ